ncbi:MAG: DUF433 domain-containing protein [Bacteroidota bacterium]
MTFVEQIIQRANAETLEVQQELFLTLAELIGGRIGGDIQPGDYDDRIRKTPGVCGGSARIRDHRLPVWGLIEYLRLGLTDEQVLDSYPFITQADLNAAKTYYTDHKLEVDLEILMNEMA